MFSFDIVTIVAGYAVSRVAQQNASPQLLSSFSATIAPIVVIASNHSNGHIWIADDEGVYVYDSQGKYLFDADFDPDCAPKCIYIDETHREVYISERFSEFRAHIFDDDGTFLRYFSTASIGARTFRMASSRDDLALARDQKDSAEHKETVQTDRCGSDSFIVVDNVNYTVCKMNRDGALVWRINAGSVEAKDTEDHEFCMAHPSCVAVNKQGHVFVADSTRLHVSVHCTCLYVIDIESNGVV